MKTRRAPARDPDLNLAPNGASASTPHTRATCEPPAHRPPMQRCAGCSARAFVWPCVYEPKTPDAHRLPARSRRFGSGPGLEEGSPRLSASLRPGDFLPRPTTSKMSWYGQVQRERVEGSERAERGKRGEELHRDVGDSEQSMNLRRRGGWVASDGRVRGADCGWHGSGAVRGWGWRAADRRAGGGRGRASDGWWGMAGDELLT